MVVRNKYGGYWNKTQSTVDSGGLSVPCMISITNIFQPTESPLIIPYYAIPDTTVSTKTGDKLVSTQDRGFPASDRHEGHTRVITITTYQIPIARNHQYALMSMFISSHKITKTPRQGVL